MHAPQEELAENSHFWVIVKRYNSGCREEKYAQLQKIQLDNPKSAIKLESDDNHMSR